jgi:MoxR-like ATPase
MPSVYKFKQEFLDFKAGDEVEVVKEPTSDNPIAVLDNGIAVHESFLDLVSKEVSRDSEDEEESTPLSRRMKPPLVSAGMNKVDREHIHNVLASGGKLKIRKHDVLTGDAEFEDLEVKVVCPAGNKRLSDVTNGRLPASGIDHIFQVYADDHFDEEVRDDIPEIDTYYYWDPDVLETLILAHKLEQKALFTGLPGTGKSSSCQQFAAHIKQPFMRIGCRGDMEASSLLGSVWAESDKMTFKKGMLPLGLEGGYLICFDEIFKIPAYIQMTMQNLYEKDGVLVIDDMPGTKKDKTIIPHEDCRIVATDNVKGTGDNFDKFAATQLQDTSSLDRFTMTKTVDYLPEKAEVDMLKSKYPTVPTQSIKDIVKVAGLVRKAYADSKLSVTLSGGRGLDTMCQVMLQDISTAFAIKLCFTEKLGDDTECQVFDQILRTVGIKIV